MELLPVYVACITHHPDAAVRASLSSSMLRLVKHPSQEQRILLAQVRCPACVLFTFRADHV